MLAPPFRALPAAIDGYGPVDPYSGQCRIPATIARQSAPVHAIGPRADKRLAGIEQAFDACGIGNGATLSFHHHLRNGDGVLNLVLGVAARRGLKGLTVAASSLFPVHAPLVVHIQSGVVARLFTAYMTGPVADAVSAGAMGAPVVMQTHGGRAVSTLTCSDGVDRRVDQAIRWG